MKIIALVDCNNFYVSCECAFNPSLNNKPVVILSNNDGCIISRSLEAKQLGIPMGAPFFKWEAFCHANHVQVFSSNYELYGDMSRRVMHLLAVFCPEIEIYSIDEAFLKFNEMNPVDLNKFILEIQKKIKTSTGIPVSIGYGPTKTLAKIANHIAKNKTVSGIFDLRNETIQTQVLADFPAKNIWGIGSQLIKRLQKLNIVSALDLRDSDAKFLRSHFSVSVEKTIQELRGISCISTETVQPRQQIISSRSFGKIVTDLSELEEAISYYAGIASNKLRKQSSVAKAMYVFLQTNIFSREAQYGNGVIYSFPVPTADSRYIIRTAKKCLQHIYKAGFKYHKAGVMLMEIQSANLKQYDMITNISQTKSEMIMDAIDKINDQLGRVDNSFLLH